MLRAAIARFVALEDREVGAVGVDVPAHDLLGMDANDLVAEQVVAQCPGTTIRAACRPVLERAMPTGCGSVTGRAIERRRYPSGRMSPIT